MDYVFGPVPSWRLGQSLGVDPVPLKTCNWNCVYCQLGRSQPVVLRRARYVPERKLIDEVRAALATAETKPIDWVTFVGSGETLLHAKIGWMLRQVKAMTDIPVAVITNGSLLCQPYVRWEVAVADAVMPSLDVGTEELYRRMNRPHREVSFARHMAGLSTFRTEYAGRLWIEVMLVRGLNDGERELTETALQLKRVRPDEIHVNGPARSPAEPWVACPDDEAVSRACKIFESVAPVRVVHPANGTFSLAADEPVVDGVVQVVTRHPLRQAELEQAVAQKEPGRVGEVLAQLKQSDRVKVVLRGGTEYWVSAGTYFPANGGKHTAIGGDRSSHDQYGL